MVTYLPNNHKDLTLDPWYLFTICAWHYESATQAWTSKKTGDSLELIGQTVQFDNLKILSK